MLGSSGAPWQEVTELVRALEALLGNPPESSRAADPGEELKIQAEAALGAVPPLPSLASERKPQGQVSCSRSGSGPSLTFLGVFPFL